MEDAEDHEFVLFSDVDPVDDDVGQVRHHELAGSLLASGVTEAWQCAQQPHRLNDPQPDALDSASIVLSDVPANGDQVLPTLA
jgi:hypothetical protein